MIFRTAGLPDIKAIQVVRHLVKENTLSRPDLVPDKDVAWHITERGRGWVCEVEGEIVAFAIIDLAGHSVWALFVDPQFAAQGIGKELLRLMVDWYFKQTRHKLQLGTASGTRAEKFYELRGWSRAGYYDNGEIKFEMSYTSWTGRP